MESDYGQLELPGGTTILTTDWKRCLNMKKENVWYTERNRQQGMGSGNRQLPQNHYNIKTNAAGKAKNKEILCERFDLDFNKPLISFIGRLVGEKGADVYLRLLEIRFGISAEK